MPIREEELRRAQERLRRKFRHIASDELFKALVSVVRQELDINPHKIRELNVQRLVAEPSTVNKPFPEGWRKFKEDELEHELFNLHLTFGQWILSQEEQGKRVSATIRAGARILREVGLDVTPETIVAALCFDFDGEEFEQFVRYSPDPVTLYYWYDAVAPTMSFQRYYSTHSRPLPRPNRIYLDVTEAHLEDVEATWPEVQEIQRRIGVTPVRPGRPTGIKAARREVMGGMTWAEVRMYVRQNPRDLSRLETEYVREETERKKLRKALGAKAPSKEDERRWRKNAIDSFYKQVIVHPEMRDFNLRLRNRGRPRKEV